MVGDEIYTQLKSEGYNIKSVYTVQDNQLRVTASAMYVPKFMDILGFGTRSLSVAATAPFGGSMGGGSLDLALVLDVTDSMTENNKIGAMKIAVNDFFNDFRDADGDVRFAVVPFSQYVNVGTQYKNELWIDNSLDGTNFTPIEQTVYSGVCNGVNVEGSCTGYQDGAPYTYTCKVCAARS